MNITEPWALDGEPLFHVEGIGMATPVDHPDSLRDLVFFAIRGTRAGRPLALTVGLSAYHAALLSAHLLVFGARIDPTIGVRTRAFSAVMLGYLAQGNEESP